MNAYDQSARYAAKADPAGFLRWLLPGLSPDLEFRGWLDARTLPFPGEPDRVCDTVAELADPKARWALVVEFQTEPDPEMLDRLLEYLARLRRELGRDKFRVAAALVQLTGQPGADTLEMILPGEPAVGLSLRIASRTLRAEDALATLREIAEGRASRWLLPWIPLMKNGGKSTMMEEWKRLAGAEPNPRARAEYASLALVFAGLTRHRARWLRALEGWNVKESAIVNEWKAEGRAEGRRDDILQILRLRFPAEVRPDLVASVEAQRDPARLSEWFTAAVTSATIDEFRTLAGL